MIIDQLFLWSALAICVLMTTAVLFLIFKSFHHRNNLSFSYFLYYAILVYVFGFYGLWSHEVISYMAIDTSTLIASKIINILGAPFLVVALGILPLWINSVFRFQIENQKMILTYAIVLIGALVYVNTKTSGQASFVDAYYTIGSIELMLCASVFAVKKSDLLSVKPRLLISFSTILLAAFFINKAMGFPYKIESSAVNHFTYFLLHSIFFTVFIAFAKFKQTINPDSLGLDMFIEKYNITRRESEIINELMSGKTNFQIAESLFITEQTVKDHMSRIFQKTHLKNRAQLISTLKN